jgi:hypothetical protein
MNKKYIDIEALNFRSAPVITPSTVLALLHLRQEVEELGPDQQAGWTRVRVNVNGAAIDGVVKSDINGVLSLRDPVSDSREALVAEAIREWLRFDQGQGQENLEPYYRYVGEMWQAIGEHYDGKDRDIPWSAAAISFMVRHAAASVPDYANFRYASSHAKYMHNSIVQRGHGNGSAPFWGFRLNEQRPQIGDIVCKWRETPHNYDYAALYDDFKSHSDIIVSVRADHVLAIGGNVNQSVSITRYDKTPSGFIALQGATFMQMINQT